MFFCSKLLMFQKEADLSRMSHWHQTKTVRTNNFFYHRAVGWLLAEAKLPPAGLSKDK